MSDASIASEQKLIVKVGPEGTFHPSGRIHSTSQSIDDLFDRLQGAHSLTLYFHGGLVSEKEGVHTAGRMITQLEKTGTTPICFVWETGLMETLSSNLSRITDSPLWRRVVRLLLRYLGGKLGITEGGISSRGGGLTDSDIDRQWQTERPFETYRYGVNTSRDSSGMGSLVWLKKQNHKATSIVDSELTAEVELDRDLISLFEASGAVIGLKDTGEQAGSRSGGAAAGWVVKHLVKIVFRVVDRLETKADHGFYPTMVEEVFREFYLAQAGAWIWDCMKTKAAHMWRSNTGRSGDDRYAGFYFLGALSRWMKGNPGATVNLVGHSAGCIAICHLLAAARNGFGDLRFDKIVFLAPACRTDLFCREVVRHPESFGSFRCFTMKDGKECRDSLVPFVYPRSLLYLVSGILEDYGRTPDVPILGMHRFLNDLPLEDAKMHLEDQDGHLRECVAFLSAGDRLVLSDTAENAAEGLQCSALHHGDFDDDPLTLGSLDYILSHS